jgi:hypothetical protein
MRLHSAFLLASALALAACGTSGELPDVDAPFRLLALSPEVVVPGTRLVVEGAGFRSEAVELSLRGDIARPGERPRRLDAELPVEVDSSTRLYAQVTDALFDAAGGGGDFTGVLWLRVTRDGRTWRASLPVSLTLERGLTPRLEVATPLVVYFGDRVRLTGSGFLLGGAEGRLEIEVTGTFTPDRGAAVPITRFPLRVEVSSRSEGAYLHGLELFGLRTGEFTGTLTPRNLPPGQPELAGAPLAVEMLVLASSLASVQPAAASRGQRVALAGSGFYDSRAEGVGTALRLEGQFVRPGGGREAVDAELPVRVEGPSAATWVLDPQLVDGALAGFGGEPGVFTGTLTPVLFHEHDELAGVPWRGTFEVLPTRQVVQLKFLPGFTEALRLFGLRNVERRVKDRILEVVRRDYAGLRLEFREDPPTDFEHWTTVELTGEDPNEVDLFGLDNTDGKDLGNLRLNDYVGGTNAAQGAIGAFAFGGVFISSFLRFSPNVCRAAREDGTTYFRGCNGASTFGLRSARFDDALGPFAPLLGGTEARVDEWSAGGRAEQVREAVRVIGNLAGNTLTHELGHSLGLAVENGVGDEFHNAGDLPGLIMNPGGARAFEERAELDGVGPAVWADGDRAYLLEILGDP